jgi:hypothetical protein
MISKLNRFTSKEMFMKCQPGLSASRILVVALFGVLAATPFANAEDSKDAQALLDALSKSKLTLSDGVRQAAKGGAVPISAKFEMEDGKLSLSVYTAEKGLSVAADQNVLQELSGSPEEEKWAPKIEVFKDVPHVARSSEQLTLMALSKSSLAAVIARTQKTQSGTVFSVTPVVRDHKPMAEILVSDNGKVKKLIQPL